MFNLLRFIIRYHHWLLFAVLEAASMVLLFGYNSRQRSVWLSSANAVAGQIYEWSEAVGRYIALQEVNNSLTGRNIELEQETARLRALYMQAVGDSATAQHGEAALTGYDVVSAHVVGSTLNSPNNMMTIDRGSADGVREDMAVVSGMGAVGMVLCVSEHYAVVMPLLNVQSHVSCRIRGRGYFGHLSWQGGSVEEVLLEDVPRHATFDLGDEVETSGYSAIFPEGILVGKITGVEDAGDGISYRLTVRTATDFAKVRDVRVMHNKGFEERRLLMRAAQDMMIITK